MGHVRICRLSFPLPTCAVHGQLYRILISIHRLQTAKIRLITIACIAFDCNVYSLPENRRAVFYPSESAPGVLHVPVTGSHTSSSSSSQSSLTSFLHRGQLALCFLSQ